LLIDSHAHLDSPRYTDDRAAMLARANEAGVGVVLAIGIGENPSEMHRALDICREFNGKPGMPRLFASAGIYPHNTPEADDAALTRLDNLLAEPEVIACGEIGLDYYHEGAPRDVQRQGLIRQLEIAAARRRPILIHCRGTNESTDAWDDLFLVLDEFWAKTGLGGIMHCFGAGWQQARRSLDMGFLVAFAGNRPILIHCRGTNESSDAWNYLFLVLDTYWRHTGLGGVMHCFGGGWEEAQRSLDMGFLVSFAGNLTYPKAQPLRDVASRMPLDGLLVETDAPWLAPAALRGKRNEPAWVTLTAQMLAESVGVTVDRIAEETTRNFARLFKLPADVGN